MDPVEVLAKINDDFRASPNWQRLEQIHSMFGDAATRAAILRLFDQGQNNYNEQEAVRSLIVSIGFNLERLIARRKVDSRWINTSGSTLGVGLIAAGVTAVFTGGASIIPTVMIVAGTAVGGGAFLGARSVGEELAMLERISAKLKILEQGLPNV
jgi:hypothetical protein